MELIKEIGSRIDKWGTLRKWGKFLCYFCKSEVERMIKDGLKQQSCECHKSKIKHGESKTRLYNIWSKIKQRCNNLNCSIYQYYGGRGITICPEWANDYTKFRDWALNNGYQEGLEIDRIDNNGNYSPENCRWVTHEVNGRNRGSVIVTLEVANEIRTLINIGKLTQKELVVKYNISRQNISDIINNKIWVNK